MNIGLHRMIKLPAPIQPGLAIFSATLIGIAIPISTAAQNIGAGLLVLAFILATGSLTQFKQSCRQPFAIAGLILGIALILGTLWTTASPAEAWRFVLKMRAYYLIPVFLLLFSAIKSRNAVLLGFSAATLLSVITSCLAAGFDYPVLFARPGDWSIFRSHSYHNYFAALLAVGLLAGLLTSKFSGFWKWAAIIIIFIVSYDILFLVTGRTGQLVFLLMMSVILILWNWRMGLLLGAVIIVVAVFALPKYSAAIQSGVNKAQADLTAYSRGDADTSLGLRLAWQKNSINLIKQQPWFGHGTGSFKTEHARVLESGNAALFTINPHNDYLWLSVDLGVGGGILLLALLLSAAWQGRRLEAAWQWTLYAMLAGMGVSTLANSFFTDNITGLAFVVLTCALLQGPKQVTATND